MAKDFSFDIESDFDMMEMTNALDQTQREISQRYDFKGTDSSIEFDDDKNIKVKFLSPYLLYEACKCLLI